jgi:prepilin-type N-terminal cleavage/methylation domain-containing protein
MVQRTLRQITTQILNSRLLHHHLFQLHHLYSQRSFKAAKVGKSLSVVSAGRFPSKMRTSLLFDRVSTSKHTLADKGFTLTEVLVALSFIGVIALVTSTFLVLAQENSQVLMLAATRDDLQARIYRALIDEKSLRVSRSRDPLFDACFKRGSANDSCAAQQEHPITIRDASGDILAGPETAPAYFRADGSRCPGQSPSCVISAIARVRAQGLPQWWNNQLIVDSASYHEFVEVIYEIQVETQKGNTLNSFLRGSYIFDTMDLESM